MDLAPFIYTCSFGFARQLTWESEKITGGSNDPSCGDSAPLNLHFNGNKIEQVIQYEHLGNILKSINNCNADMFANIYPY